MRWRSSSTRTSKQLEMGRFGNYLALPKSKTSSDSFQLSKTRPSLDGVAQSARGTMEPPDVTPSPRGILRPSGSFKKRQLERLMLEEAGSSASASSSPRVVGQRLFSERPSPSMGDERSSTARVVEVEVRFDDASATREALVMRGLASSADRSSSPRGYREGSDENSTSPSRRNHLKMAALRRQREEALSAAADAASSVDAEVQEVDALVDALRGLACDDDASDGTDSPRFEDASNGAPDDSADSFRSAEDDDDGYYADETETPTGTHGASKMTMDDASQWSPDTVLRPDGLFDTESPSPSSSSSGSPSGSPVVHGELRRQSSVTFDEDGVTVHDIGSVKDLRREKRVTIAGAIVEWVKADVRGFVENALWRRRRDSAEELESAKATRKSLRESRRNMYTNVDNCAYGWCGDPNDRDFTFV